jgi:hypothetical protein
MISPCVVISKSMLDQKGRLSLGEVWRCRATYFTDGTIKGSRAFVKEAFARHRWHFGAKRETGTRSLVGAEWGDLYTARQLRIDVLGVPATS